MAISYSYLSLSLWMNYTSLNLAYNLLSISGIASIISQLCI